MRRLLVALLLGLSGCAAGEDFVRAHGQAQPTLERVEVCHGFGCAYRTRVAIAPSAWREVERVFRPPPAGAADERRRIALAIGLIEEMLGEVVGTAGDEAGATLFAADRLQQDCIDETVNTTTYLRLMQASGLLAHHDPAPAAARGRFVDGWPHNTAVIVERASGAAFAVDSWFHANGEAAEIVPLAAWLAGWQPERRIRLGDLEK